MEIPEITQLPDLKQDRYPKMPALKEAHMYCLLGFPYGTLERARVAAAILTCCSTRWRPVSYPEIKGFLAGLSRFKELENSYHTEILRGVIDPTETGFQTVVYKGELVVIPQPKLVNMAQKSLWFTQKKVGFPYPEPEVFVGPIFDFGQRFTVAIHKQTLGFDGTVTYELFPHKAQLSFSQGSLLGRVWGFVDSTIREPGHPSYKLLRLGLLGTLHRWWDPEVDYMPGVDLRTYDVYTHRGIHVSVIDLARYLAISQTIVAIFQEVKEPQTDTAS